MDELVSQNESNEKSEQSDGTELIDGGKIDDSDQQGGNIPLVNEGKYHTTERHREETARRLAYLLVWIMVASVGFHYLITGLFLLVNKVEIIEGLSEIFNMWLPVITGFVGSTITYYYTKEKR